MRRRLFEKLKTAVNDDSGVSLLELIIAVTILAIVTAPLLNTYIVSARLNAKAKTTGLETNAITSIYEKIKGVDSSDIVSASKDGTITAAETDRIKTLFQANGATITPTVKESTDGSHKKRCRSVDIDLTGVASGNVSGDRTYDAKVSMTAIPTGTDDLVPFMGYTSDDVNKDNDEPRALQMSFDNVWLQPTDSSDPDSIILSNLPDKVKSDSDAEPEKITKDPDARGQRILKNQRLITISLETTKADNGMVKVTPKITYEYDVKWLELVKQGKTERLVQKRIYSDDHKTARAADSEDTAIYTKKLSDFTYIDPGKKEADHHFFDVMVFYRPYYDAVNTDNGKRDTVTIENESNLEGDLFLVKEKPDDTKDYSGLVRLIEDHPTDKENFKLKVHTNMGLKQGISPRKKEVLSGGTFSMIKVYNADGYYNLSEELRNADSTYSLTSLIKEEAVDHIYKVHIELYRSGELGSGTPVCTFNGIKVN